MVANNAIIVHDSYDVLTVQMVHAYNNNDFVLFLRGKAFKRFAWLNCSWHAYFFSCVSLITRYSTIVNPTRRFVFIYTTIYVTRLKAEAAAEAVA